MRASELWIFGGLDPSGGAGLLRDAWSLEDPVREASAFFPTVWTWQKPGSRQQVKEVDPRSAEARVRRALERGPPRAIKVGLVGCTSADPIRILLEGLKEPPPLVLDPVLSSSRGQGLGDPKFLEGLWQFATIVTPNVDEARALLSARGEARGEDSLGAELARSLACCVLLKGIRVGAEAVRDELYDRSGKNMRVWQRPRLQDGAGADPRGTGCYLSTRIALALAQGRELADACALAIDELDVARTAAVARGMDSYLPLR